VIDEEQDRGGMEGLLNRHRCQGSQDDEPTLRQVDHAADREDHRHPERDEGVDAADDQSTDDDLYGLTHRDPST